MGMNFPMKLSKENNGMSRLNWAGRGRLLGFLSLIFTICLIGFVSGFTSSVHAATQVTLYASPTGSGSTCSLAAPCSLVGAQAKVRTLNGNMSGDIIVELRGGTYTLSSSFTLRENSTLHDSGTNGYNVVYEAYPGEKPMISGGKTITGWSLYNSATNVYRAHVGTSLQTLQLYVNGVRANVTKSAKNPTGFTKTSAGWTTTNTAMQSWRNPKDIRIVTLAGWKYLSCNIASISGTNITMQTPCWNNAGTSPNPGHPYNGQGIEQMNSITYVENAYELLKNAGDWYLDRGAGYLYYIPRSGENLSTASVVAPVVEKLVDGSGASLTQPLHNIVFSGITFAYATWLQPAGSQGYADNQSGILWINAAAPAKTLGNISFQYSHNITLKNDTFTHLGGVAIDFGNGAQNNFIGSNTITDISSNGISLGEVTDYATTNSNQMTSGNTIQKNLIYNIGQDYADATGIWVGYSKNTLLTHNTVYNISNTGISVGWGWGTNSYAQNNQITYNLVHDTLKVLGEGGSIYTLSSQPGSTENNNYIYNAGSAGRAIYHDEGSQHFTDTYNVVGKVTYWLSMSQTNIAYNTVEYNYVYMDYLICNGSKGTSAHCNANHDVVKNNTFTNGVWPSAAQTIMNNAGQ
jgi:Right handed beta helix region